MAGAQLTPEAFKAEFKRKGWTGKALAARWEVSEAWISKVVKKTSGQPAGMMLFGGF